MYRNVLSGRKWGSTRDRSREVRRLRRRRHCDRGNEWRRGKRERERNRAQALTQPYRPRLPKRHRSRIANRALQAPIAFARVRRTHRETCVRTIRCVRFVCRAPVYAPIIEKNVPLCVQRRVIDKRASPSSPPRIAASALALLFSLASLSGVRRTICVLLAWLGWCAFSRGGGGRVQTHTYIYVGGCAERLHGAGGVGRELCVPEKNTHQHSRHRHRACVEEYKAEHMTAARWPRCARSRETKWVALQASSWNRVQARARACLPRDRVLHFASLFSFSLYSGIRGHRFYAL